MLASDSALRLLTSLMLPTPSDYHDGEVFRIPAWSTYRSKKKPRHRLNARLLQSDQKGSGQRPATGGSAAVYKSCISGQHVRTPNVTAAADEVRLVRTAAGRSASHHRPDGRRLSLRGSPI